MSDKPQATVRRLPDGGLVLDDPVAAAFIEAVESHNHAAAKAACRSTFDLHADRVQHFKRRLTERGMTPNEAVIVVINVDDPHGGPLAEALMPGHDWQSYRDRGQVPFARGLAMRTGIEEVLDLFDQPAAEQLRRARGVVAVVVDHGVAEVFEV